MSSQQKRMLLAFPDDHDPYTSIITKAVRSGPILQLIQAYEYDYVVLFALPYFTTENLILAIEEVAPHSQVQVIDCSDFLEGNPLGITSSLRAKLQEIQPDFLKQEVTVCLGGVVYINLHTAILNLCSAGELPCRLVTVRPVYALSSHAPMFEEVDFFSPSKVNLEEAEHSAENSLNQKNIKEAERFGIVGTYALKETINMCASFAPSHYPILILGETGTGKSLFAKYIHSLSGRPQDLFIDVNCAAIPDNLVESVLFGHKKGSFTGATSDQVGKFVQANGGTLFLDEIGEMPLAAQAKILKVLEDGQIDVLGSGKYVKVDVKIIAATNKDLIKAIQEGTFRSDLYYRINVGQITIPPLRERVQDIRSIALKTVKHCNEFTSSSKMLSNSALEALEQREWNGNIRELEHVLQKAFLLSQKLILGVEDIFPQEKSNIPDDYGHPWTPGVPIEPYLKSVREHAFKQAIEISNGNQSAAARLLGVSHQAISQFLKKKQR